MQTAPDAETLALLAQLLRSERVGALGTLRGGAPLVSMAPFLAEEDFSAFWLHLSRLAWHTQDMLREPRIAFSIAQTDDRRADPYTLARITIRAEATQLPSEGADNARLKRAWLARFTNAQAHFQLADFSFWRLAPRDARFVAGLGRIHNLNARALSAAAKSPARQ